MYKERKIKFLEEIAFLFLFAAEFTFYLLVLQTGVVVVHHSLMTEIWMLPVGGILGIILSFSLYPSTKWFLPVLLLLQTLLSLQYATASSVELFAFGMISGLTAPLLIAQVRRFSTLVLALALSYAFGSYVFDVPAIDRTSIAVGLSLVAFVFSLFAFGGVQKRKTATLTPYHFGSIFLWLLLDATLFETLSRNAYCHLWGDATFVWNLIVAHSIGLVAAYIGRDYRYNNRIILGLFVLTFSLYQAEWKWALSFVYPFVISYYNVIILRTLTRLPYPSLVLMALALWAASGFGLMLALNGSFAVAWVLVILLGAVEFYFEKDITLNLISTFTKPFKLKD